MKQVLLAASLVLVSSPSWAAEGRFGVHGGVGTDVTLGLAVGLGASYAFDVGTQTLEIGPDLFYHHSKESSEENGNTYDEETWLTVFAVRANFLFDYDPEVPGTYFVLGGGFAAVSIEWEETSEDDPTADDSFEATSGATILNAGVGYVFGGGFEIELELPVLVAFSGPNESAVVAPALTVTGGIRF